MSHGKGRSMNRTKLILLLVVLAFVVVPSCKAKNDMAPQPTSQSGSAASESAQQEPPEGGLLFNSKLSLECTHLMTIAEPSLSATLPPPVLWRFPSAKGGSWSHWQA